MHRVLALIAIFVSLLASAAHAQAPLTTAFTYQGQLDQNGTPANGPHDLRFELYDNALGGLPINATTLCFNDVPVTSGRFTVTLDFGDVLDGSRRFLQLQVRSDTTRNCPDLAGFTILGPRQELTIAPHAGFALRALDSTLLGGFPASYYTNASNISSGILADARVPASIPRLATANTFTQNNVFNSNFTGIRRSARITGSEVFGIQGNDDGVGLLYTGMYIASNTGNARPFYGMITSLGDVAWTYLDGSDASWRVNVASQDRLTITSAGNVGIGTTTPTAALEVRGDIRLGSTGTLRAASGEENLRIVRGRVASNGSMISGNGFIATRLGTGVYRITYSSAFVNIPAVTVTTQSSAETSAVILSLNASVVDINTFNAAGVAADTSFSFIAIGPR